jgi:phosphoribosylformimino-5-aminoimidazole carboxamide ribotide isomerase
MVEIIPVLDIRGGIAVSGKSGNRESYGPLKSVYSSQPNLLKLAIALPFERLYVADLDGIVNRSPDMTTLVKIASIKSTMADIGIRDSRDLDLFDGTNLELILGTETLKDYDILREALERFEGEVLVSIDIKGGKVISSFLPKDPVKCYEALTSVGVDRVIFLNISAVGTQRPDFSFIKNINKTGEILVGGGSTKKSLHELKKNNVDGVLVGTALHRGDWM